MCLTFVSFNFTKLSDELYLFSGSIFFFISLYGTMLPGNSDCFTSSFTSWILLFLFLLSLLCLGLLELCWIKVRVSILVLFMIFRGNVFGFSLSCGFFIYSFYFVEVSSLHAYFLENIFFIINRYLILSKLFLSSIDMILWLLFFSLLM